MPFRGDTSGTVFDAILNRPPTSAVRLNPDVSEGLERIIDKALEKDRGIRYQHASELRADLKRLRRDSESGSKAAIVVETRPQKGKSPLLWGALAVIVAALAVGGALRLRRPSVPAVADSSHWVQLTNLTDSTYHPALSPDGRMVAFLHGSEFLGSGQLFVKMLPDGDPVQLTHDETTKWNTAFSPDGSRIAYGTAGNDWQTWVVPVLGGQPQLLLSNSSGLDWIDPHHIMFSEIKSGWHFAVATSTESRTEERDVYVPRAKPAWRTIPISPPTARRSWLSRWIGDHWLPCRLVPFAGGAAKSVVRKTAGAPQPHGRRMVSGCTLCPKPEVKGRTSGGRPSLTESLNSLRPGPRNNRTSP